jgi:hypothetical protein
MVSSVRNYIFVFGNVLRGNAYGNDNFRFTEKRIPFCQETIIVSIRLQQLCNDLIWRASLRMYKAILLPTPAPDFVSEVLTLAFTMWTPLITGFSPALERQVPTGPSCSKQDMSLSWLYLL